MHTQDQQQSDFLYLPAGLAVIFFLATWAAWFSHTCQSDGCAGVVCPAGGAVIVLLVQLLILVPVFCLRRARSKLRYGRLAAAWIGGSLAAFIAPMLFAKL